MQTYVYFVSWANVLGMQINNQTLEVAVSWKLAESTTDLKRLSINPTQVFWTVESIHDATQQIFLKCAVWS